jgi:polyisoprenyl-teichoic acid--peptidoglycan teichoic acid transferase
MRVNGKKRMKRMIIILSIFIFTCLSAIGGVYLYIRYNIFAQIPNSQPYNNSFSRDTTEDFFINHDMKNDDVTENVEEVQYEEQIGITNILLIGTDARKLNENARSDSIIIVTIDDNNKKLKLTSILRDTYVTIPRHSQQKINAAFVLGGPQLLMDTIEKNFKLKLDKYIIINFWGFENMIDALGGIDIDIKDYEIDEINKYIGEVRENKSQAISFTGIQHLDGQQTLAYARIRKVGNGSYERSLRQRRVLSILAQKLKEIKVVQYPLFLGKLLPCVQTNIEPISFLNYAYTVSKFKPLEIKQIQMPMTELSDGRIYRGTWVFLMDKEQNTRVLNDFIFKDKITETKELNLKSCKIKIDEYLKREAKTSRDINKNELKLKKERENSDYRLPIRTD